ncbi:MAG: hypothetical protein RLZZ175_260 [Bacteroidota bacterium]|jgi:precorrin-2 dehydrogenase/sirohydrochlorin ferrochelatase
MENTNLEGNLLFPIFLCLYKLRVLVVGGGYVGFEKVSTLYKNSPNANITLVAPEIKEEIIALSKTDFNLTLKFKPFETSDLTNIDLVIAATNLPELNREVRCQAKMRRILVNVADTPALCDFYLSSVVKKGDLKIGISTNGKSPTFAKRFREVLEEILPDSINDILSNLNKIRNTLKGDFNSKVDKLNEITSVLNPDNKNGKT